VYYFSNDKEAPPSDSLKGLKMKIRLLDEV
jgi:hypothetical protein